MPSMIVKMIKLTDAYVCMWYVVCGRVLLILFNDAMQIRTSAVYNLNTCDVIVRFHVMYCDAAIIVMCKNLQLPVDCTRTVRAMITTVKPSIVDTLGTW